ncbi:MAG: 50S ribosomal protein L3 [Candidatus Heimdallarchaeaceae archaeon]
MGHRKASAPHRSSLGYRRVRAKRIVPTPRAWQKYEGAPKLLGFLGIKAGMTHCIYIEDKPRSHLANREVTVAVTCIETPPLVVFGLRGYKKTPYGLKIVADLRTLETKDELKRKLKLPKKYDFDKVKKNFDDNIKEIHELRAVVHTQPYLTGIGMKTPQIAEIKIGCSSIEEGYQYGLSLLGKEVLIRDVFKAGEFVDTIGVTKGKGFQGPVKRHGIKILQHKSKGTKRGVGSIGPWHPARTMWTIPRYGQMGFNVRTDYNKRIMQIGSDGTQIVPDGGFIKYGVVKNNYVLLKGSVPGSKKRTILLRAPVRKPPQAEKEPQILFISTKSQQG